MTEDISRRSHAQWIDLIQEQGLSPLTIAEFCEEQGLAVHSFYYHKQKMNQERCSKGFVEIHPATGGMRLRYDQDTWVIDLKQGFDRLCMKQLLQVVDP